MKTIEDFFSDLSALKEHLESRSGKTVHTEKYQNTCIRLYSEWQNVKSNLQTFLSDEDIERIDESFSKLLKESRRAKPRISESKNLVDDIEEIYLLKLSHKLNETNVELTFVNNLINKLDKISNEKYADYLEESIRCVQVNAYRGAVVLGWQAAIYALYKELDSHSEPIHVSYHKKFGHKPEIEISTFWDFQKVSDREILILAEYVGVIDKSLKDVLEDEKNIRNKAAHPGKFDVGPNRVKALLESVMELLIELDLEKPEEE